MATLLLTAAGAAIGGSFSGSVAGLTTLALGKAVGATLGSVIDQRLMGLGSAPVETGRVDRFRVMGSSEGAALPRIFGRMRVSGQIIWSSRFLESSSKKNVRGGKGGGGSTIREFSYSISLAVALCEAEVSRIGRIWADGQAIDQSGLAWRLHSGTEGQFPDPLIAAIEGSEAAPAYRGTAYVVFENLDLTPYGNRIPQFSFEVFRRPFAAPGLPKPPALDINAIALVPGSGEYALATQPVFLKRGKQETISLNVHNDQGQPDLVASMEQLTAELPNNRSVSLVVSWFGDDLRCDRCTLQPAVEQDQEDGSPLPWRVSDQARSGARVVTQVDGRPLFGGTPDDATVLQAISHLKSIDQSVMFYPFILMDLVAGNGREDPWTGGAEQLPVPWRGRITLSRAPGRPGTTDKTGSAADEVEAFFGSAKPSDFSFVPDGLQYIGPPEWSYRRFILHYAHLCARAGGVGAFCIGSEMRGLTQIRDGAASYPAVRELCRLAEDVRQILGPSVRIGYAADWSEYFGHQPSDNSGDVFFHLDPLWSHPEIGFVGIDNYMPLSDWRDGSDHADAAAGSIYNLEYLMSNIAGGEGYDWYYADSASRESQVRLPITDGAYGEDWIFRYKDIKNWWSRQHFNRSGGVRSDTSTDWIPESKPIWFTEFGCPAVDKATNQPNIFHDPKSSESFFPYYSNAAQDEYIQYRYLQATYAYWRKVENNPLSTVYGSPMVDMAHAHVWAWDARPWPDFPNREEIWADGPNYERGHWLNGRVSRSSLSDAVAEICLRSEMTHFDVSMLYGSLTGYMIGAVESARQSLQPLMIAFAFDSFGRHDRLAFASRSGLVARTVQEATVAVAGSHQPEISLVRGPTSETAGRITLGFVKSGDDYQAGAAKAIFPGETEANNAETSVPLVLNESEAQAIAERWLGEGLIAKDTAEFALPPSALALIAGDVVSLQVGAVTDLYRIDRIEELGRRAISAVRVEPRIYDAPVHQQQRSKANKIPTLAPVHVEFLDIPLISGDENPYAPHVGACKSPWFGAVSIFSSTSDFGYSLNSEIRRTATMGETLEPLVAGLPGLWMRVSLRVRIRSGDLQSSSPHGVLNGANIAAVRSSESGDWEIIQFEAAELVGPGEYRLFNLLRGQCGTDGVMPPVWPAGSDFILLDEAIVQLDLPASYRGLERHYRIGPSVRPYDDSSYVHEVRSFVGIGLRPYRPAHLRAVRRLDGAIEVSWIRRTRIDGDSWQSREVPLGEVEEIYDLRVLNEGQLLREYSPRMPSHTYLREEQSEDGGHQSFTFEVAQVSDRFGPGPYERIVFDG